jgi:peptidoglycan/xylan/chitin deacetylase (PgdA/CDA1 family)
VRRHTGPGGVALTFDDGPHPSSTPQILDVLADKGVPATFFCVGRNARAYPALVARIRAEAHVIGSHSLTHPHPAQIPLSRLATEYREGRRAVSEVVGADTALFRPPHGHLGVRSAAMVRRQGLVPWLWSVDTGDWRPGVTAAHVAAVASTADSGDVVLMHDWVEEPWAPSALDRSATIQALPEVIDAIRARGLMLTTLSA